MLKFHLESWAAVAPGLETQDDWKRWLQNPAAIDEPLGKLDLSAVPPLLRRRFNPLGKCAMAAALPLVRDIDSIPSVFASRHGDTALSFSLLRGIGLGEPMSPTSFSLAVHNAIAGLFSIVRKDTSPVTAIAAVQGLALNCLIEAALQLEESERVLCLVYDAPLPEFYRQHCGGDDPPFPHAIAMIVSRANGTALGLEPVSAEAPSASSLADFESMRLIALLSGLEQQVLLQQNGSSWRLARSGA